MYVYPFPCPFVYTPSWMTEQAGFWLVKSRFLPPNPDPSTPSYSLQFF